ncbi:DUF397 domain-containing protein [Streptomyces sp. NBC_00190]|uniref:DUF397 domain-containing protein n=1 Tax=unclassified Streptomyces TaxID=2593676 RepID=UPI002E2AF79A|nr:DUF397 domain-containing protein [Streptomyces sp. NBC_00190]WSZ40085.1 DUF397 domain-containing protein [Streptomyces sp. NBC_00868]
MSIKPSVGDLSALSWVKSSYSASSSNDCVEVAWVKSSYSASNSNDCVEVAVMPEAILIRDSKDVDGGHLAVAPATWTGFVRYAAG